MTIAVGMRCKDGLVLCADTQETRLPAGSKVNTPKLRIEPFNRVGKDSADELMIAVAGAGDGPFIDKIVERAWEDVQLASNFDEACHQIEESIKLTHKEYRDIFQTGYMPDTQLVYGVKMHGNSKLFSSRGPIVNEKPHYDSAGAGYYMADFLASRLHQPVLSASQVKTLAAYILFQCKEHVDGCGGDSHIAVLSEKGASELAASIQVKGRTELVTEVDEILSYLLLLPSSDPQTSDEEFSDVFETAIDALIHRRDDAKKELARWENIRKKLTSLAGTRIGPSIAEMVKEKMAKTDGEK